MLGLSLLGEVEPLVEVVVVWVVVAPDWAVTVAIIELIK